MQLTYGIRVGAFFGALFLIYGVHLPFFPLWLEWRGLTPGEISVIVAVPYFLRLVVSPSVAFVADRTGRHRAAIIVLAWAGVVLSLAIGQLYGFGPILLAAVGLSLAMTTIMPLTEVIAVGGVRHHGCDYGRMRLWGSLTFILASSVAAWVIGRFGVGSVVWLLVAGTAATVAGAYLLPSVAIAEDCQDADGRSKEGAGGIETVDNKVDAAAVMALLRTPVFLMFLVACGLAQAAHATYYAFGSIHWASQGLAPLTIGILWGIGVLAEVALFAWSGKVFERFSVAALMVVGAGASVLRWAVMAADPGLVWLVVLQLLHALTFGASHLAAIRFISLAVEPKLSGTAQAIYSTIAMGVAMGAATLLSGWYYESLNGATYLIMAAISMVGVCAAVGVWRYWSGDVLRT
ncbi:MAG: 3-phenylpropionate MFS transporter [Alphaproteobacteria bacterium]|nr:3-phenylpropionate MFS transporter [Alphaproteobacteria bacterium]